LSISGRHETKLYGRADGAEQIADTLVAAAKGLMRSSDGIVPYERFHDRLKRLVGWVVL
jgi:hypothetical protein